MFGSMPDEQFRDESAAAAIADRFSAAELLALATLLGGFIGVAA
jgi:hypothetical protein